ncbi:MAG: helix-turn-helix domain-containing protein [Balneolaceae bacterium]
MKNELERLNIPYTSVELGYADLKDHLTETQWVKLNKALNKTGLELMEDKKSIMIEKIKRVIIEMVHYSNELPKVKYSCFISEKLSRDYNYLSTCFSEVTGTSIEHFIILHKIERVKELLMYNEYTLTEISYKMDYSSVAHLSNQFKKVTGVTPSHFKKLKNKKRTALEQL